MDNKIDLIKVSTKIGVLEDELYALCFILLRNIFREHTDKPIAQTITQSNNDEYSYASFYVHYTFL